MADGTSLVARLAGPMASDRLAASAAPGWRLHARCPVDGCGAQADIDPENWLAQGLGGAPIRAFETRLRCICGGRRAVLDLRPGPGARTNRPPIRIFR